MASARKITTPNVPEPAGGIYANCFVVGDQVLMSGMTAGGPDGKPIGGDSMEAQARAVFTKIRHLVEAAGATMDDIVKMTVYVTDMSKRPEIGKVRSEVFPRAKPCSTLVEVKSLAGPGLLIEVDATAIIGCGALSAK
jgi:enamine deaminase RidA (YjgF/YER057c/UK114 family)